MIVARFAYRNLAVTTPSKLAHAQATRVFAQTSPAIRLPAQAFSWTFRRHDSAAAVGSQAQNPQPAVPSHMPASDSPAEDHVKHAAYLGEADSNDGHEAYRDAYGVPPPPLDANNSAYLGEADSDDGFEGRRVAHPEEGEHHIEDASTSGLHGQSGEGDGPIEEAK